MIKRNFILFFVFAVGLAACTPKEVKLVKVTKPYVKPVLSIYDKLAQNNLPTREKIRSQYRYDRAIRTLKIPGFKYYFYEPHKKEIVVGFSLTNKGSARINPKGLGDSTARREFIFQFADQARENIHLAVNDDVDVSGRFSHDNMFRELHFFPRRQLPSITQSRFKSKLDVILPTGEHIIFDATSKEILAGVLKERPIDFTKSRKHRRNPRLKYTGDFLMITAAQRGESPRRAKIWGVRKQAEVYYPAKYDRSCRVSPKLIWDQRAKKGDNDPTLTMLHITDSSLFKMIEDKCDWDLSALKTKVT